MKDSWEEVASLRDEAGRYALAGDDLAAALLDARASQMAERLRAKEAAEERMS